MSLKQRVTRLEQKVPEQIVNPSIRLALADGTELDLFKDTAAVCRVLGWDGSPPADSPQPTRLYRVA